MDYSPPFDLHCGSWVTAGLQMSAHTLSVVIRPPKTRSRVSNGSSSLLRADGRSVEARRYRDLVEGFEADLGGRANLSEATRQLIRRAATLAIQCELMESGTANGQPFDVAAYVTASNAHRRILQTIGLKRVEARPKTLVQHLAETAAKRAQRETEGETT